MQEIPQFGDAYRVSKAMPERILLAKTSDEIREILDDYLDEIMTAYQNKRISNPIAQRMLELIEKDYAQQLTLSTMAEKLHISSAYASRVFKENTGVSFKWYLNEVRMDATYNYLKRTNMPIHEIAMKVGYVEVRSFYKMFKSHFGVTCSQIREMYSSTGKADTEQR
ncbi:MAG: AraC family transcriptional regulator [Clostridiales Family XIII bacterium]|nr:AraC family transcriptional regulator [Clostridiales Family XIII bacterium]